MVYRIHEFARINPFATQEERDLTVRKMRMEEDRCLTCGATREDTEVRCAGQGSHVFLRDLFGKRADPVDSNLDETSMDEAPTGMGLPGERFDLRCPDCAKTFLRLKKSVHGFFYGCPSWPDCIGTHGAHPDGRPKGIPGNKATRLARIAAHTAFDVLFKGPKPQMTVHEAYAWMAREMKLSTEEAYIARFSIGQCDQLIRLVNVKLGPSAWDHLENDPFDQVELEPEEEDLRRPSEALSNGIVVLSINNFIASCINGNFTSFNGSGYYGTLKTCSTRPVSCEALSNPLWVNDTEYTHVWWSSNRLINGRTR